MSPRAPAARLAALIVLASACSAQPVQVGTWIAARGERSEMRVALLAEPPPGTQPLRGPLLDGLRRAEPRFRQCYAVDLAGAPARGGHLVYDWTLEPNGQLVDVVLAHSSLGDRRVERCLRDALLTTRLSAPGGPGRLRVEHHIVLEPR